MKKLSAALLLFLGLASAALAQFSGPVPVTQASVTFGSTTAMAKIITGAASKSIYLTNIVIHPATTSVVTLSYGTGTNCATGTTVFYGPSTFQAGENVQVGNGAGALFVVPPAQDVCITIATAAAPGWISYAQF